MEAGFNKVLSLPDAFILPDYVSGSIANIPATVARLLKTPFDGLPPLRSKLWEPYEDRTKRVVILLIDSMGWDMFHSQQAVISSKLLNGAMINKITSVFPSTTVAALSSLWTGAAPAQHGMVGLRLFFPDQAVLTSMIRFSPAFGNYPEALVNAGVDPEDFLAVEGLGQQLAKAGIPSFAFKSYDILRGPLSTMFDRGVKEQYGFVSSADLFVRLRHFLEQTAGQPSYTFAYWPAVDTISHVHGPDHESVGAEIRSIFHLIEQELVASLSSTAREGTLLIITADHGHVPVSLERAIIIDEVPAVADMLLMKPAGEPRVPYLYARQGASEALLAKLKTHFGGELVAESSATLLNAGLFGPLPHSSEATHRLGDIVLIAKDNYIILTKPDLNRANRYKGLHGGLTATEMEVPWIVRHLGD